MKAGVRTRREGLTINYGNTILLTDAQGEIWPQQRHGLFANDTRFISRYRLLFYDQPWELQNAGVPAPTMMRCFLTNPAFEDLMGQSSIEQECLELMLLRCVEDGLQESFTITSYAAHPLRFVFKLEIESDFADLMEVRAGKLQPREGLRTQWSAERRELTTRYQHASYSAACTYQVTGCATAPTWANGCLTFPLTLAPKQSWEASARVILQQGTRTWAAAGASPQERARSCSPDQEHQAWVASCTGLTTPAPDLQQAYSQARDDMGALRLYDDQPGSDLWVPAAGMPWYLTLFGRDALVASTQCLLVQPRFATGALRLLARYQAQTRDDWLDAQPGKMPHELRRGELAYFNHLPKSPGYNTWDATSLYLVLVHAVWRWLGDRSLLEELRPVVEGCLHWIDTSGDLDGDGFQEYACFSAHHVENMSWKDASGAVVYPDGQPVRQPKATCELQAYAYAAKQGMAEVFRALGDEGRASELECQAADLKRRFNEAFWLEDEGTYAFGLDPDKKQIKTVVSNAGLCLWAGIADEDKAERVVRRLLAPDMWSGWGIRTLSTRNPAYNPLKYQLGAVWPVDNSLCAAGMKRYGFHQEANQVMRALLDAAAQFELCRLPEVFFGHERQGESFPVQYIGANVPQAWSSGAIFLLVQTLLGLVPDAPNGRLWVNPTLPEWAPRVELTRLQVGGVTLDLRFWREGGATRYEVLAQEGGALELVALFPQQRGG